jgi:hypothetical protein
MEECQQPLALPAPNTPTLPTEHTVQTVAPATHQTPTTIHAYTPPTELESLIDSIPAPVYIQNVQFNVQQHAIYHGEQELERMQAQLGQADDLLHKLIQFVQEQFAGGNEHNRNFQNAMAEGC